MKIGITGSSGLVGSQLSERLKKEFHADILKIPRSYLYGEVQSLSEYIGDCDVIINLAGASIVCRWTSKNMKRIYDSRVLTTRNLTSAIALMDKKPKLVISTSAVGIYDSIHTHDEWSTHYSNDFLGNLCLDWEKPVIEKLAKDVRTIIFRLGIILSGHGGVLARSLPIFRIGLGGKLGDGKQAFPFIHIDDLINAYVYAISNTKILGVYNLVAPQLTSNFDYTKELGNTVNRPTIFGVPSAVLRFLFKNGANVFLSGQKVLPQRLLNTGFRFKYPKLIQAISSIVNYSSRKS
ncbi:TIGR01777 family oxidoreductase [Labilibaculum sp. DW002]|uniref:TIGR01777 family oxidoreductase n=1 Tax=Paralabilibaculum antarcticum TaxID=2912572 RepID=A0ABT5VPC1_9BACT|nr:TIGR01777 family oxidoreductase [Labilibaculum sp. DW002]MDE5417121.1 TIGR01777 family oxidoreductase [Labilibaculum sp. DW002]